MSHLKIVSETGNSFNVTIKKNGGTLNQKDFTWDVIEVKKNTFHIIKNNKSYNVEILSANFEEKLFFIKVNGLKYKLNVKDKYDELLQSLGMDNLSNKKVSNLKAPMPGLVLDISTKEGETVKKGDTLLILEAMKMENAIKSPTDGIIKNIAINKGEAVEKNQVILNFE